jgi:hypothetical protein
MLMNIKVYPFPLGIRTLIKKSAHKNKHEPIGFTFGA